jgi:hypothetical protein
VSIVLLFLVLFVTILVYFILRIESNQKPNLSLTLFSHQSFRAALCRAERMSLSELSVLLVFSLQIYFLRMFFLRLGAATVAFGRKCNLENFVKHASSVPSLSVSRGSFVGKGGHSVSGFERGIHFNMELDTHPGMFVSANLYATGVVKVTLAKTDLITVFNQLRDSLISINSAALRASPPACVYDSSESALAWSDLKLALVKKQFDLGFRIKYECQLHACHSILDLVTLGR